MTQRFSPALSPARLAAFQVLRGVAEGQYASDALRSATHGISARDAGLASQIVFGSLRFQAQLDYLIYFYSRRRLDMLQPEVVIALRMSLFQLRYLDRIPPHAAVYETVELVKSVKRAAAGLVNAVLRKIRRDPVPWPDRATELSCPEWLLERWSSHFGDKAATDIARAALHEPVPYIRVPPGSPPPAGLTLGATSVPGCFRILSTAVTGEEGDAAPPGLLDESQLSANPVRNSNAVRLHDIGSQAVLPRLGLKPGHSYLDLCAAPGNKTRQALETPLSLAVACDVSLRRLRTVPPICHRVALDGTRTLPFDRKFDRIFIDAPCSGTGTCGRNPEIKWRVQAHELEAFAERQKELLAAAIPLLAPGGKLLYATCSLEKEENEDVVRHTLSKHPEIVMEEEDWHLPGAQRTGDGEPELEPGDGFYGALFGLKVG